MDAEVSLALEFDLGNMSQFGCLQKKSATLCPPTMNIDNAMFPSFLKIGNIT